MDWKETAACINRLGAFCGPRDVERITREELRKRFSLEQADVMVLFGGSILCGAQVLAQAMRQQAAKTFLIVGGEGHTTESLRRRVHEECPEVPTEGLSEAECFAAYLWRRYGLRADYLETKSTNCGNNVSYCLDLLREKGIRPKSILFTQDASMQRRMEAGFRKQCEPGTVLINFAAYAAQVEPAGEGLAFREEIPGMWPLERYLTLLMGEIPRLTDDENGYGPRGKGFIAHVEIPAQVRAAYEYLNREYGGIARPANEAYASR